MAESTTITATPHVLPGDGAFLASRAPQPGDGAYLAQTQVASGSRNPYPNGNGNDRRQPQMNGHGRNRGRGRGGAPNGTRGPINGDGRLSNQHQNGLQRLNSNGPAKPEESRVIVEHLPEPSVSNGNGHPNAVRSGQPLDEPISGNTSLGTSPSKPKHRRGHQPNRKRENNTRLSDNHSEDNKTNNHGETPLNPSATSFTPKQPANPESNSAPVTTNTSRTSSPNRQNGAETDHGARSKPPRNRNANQGKGKSDDPPKSRLARREAFDRGAKLTPTSGAGEAVSTPRPSRNAIKEKEPDADDLISKLTRGLKSKPFLECPICFNQIFPSQHIWSCLPPHKPPPPPPPKPNLNDPSPTPTTASTSNYYSACYTPFHYACIKDWANRSLAEESERARSTGRGGEEPEWRCPGCQKRRQGRVVGYRCFCGRLSHPPTNTSAPHSCGNTCARPRANCEHACSLNCHPGPCPPCQVNLIIPCPSHSHPLSVKCSAASPNDLALSPVCDEICGRPRKCRKPEHVCRSLCHYGDCTSCDDIEEVWCYCGEEKKVVECGWGIGEELICVKLKSDADGVVGRVDEVEGGVVTVTWKGRFSCGRACERLYDCGIHICKEKCHPHSLAPLPCLFSPSAITHCPCGKTPLSALPNYPRSSCTSPVPTCKSPCPKSRPCGHKCPRTCHSGDCPPCHEEIVRTCRCGEGVLVVGCDEIREREEHGQGEVTCERVCRALRNCGRHECGRICCPLSYKAKSKNKRRGGDEFESFGNDDLHVCPLTCGKMLSCGLHTCPKPDHKGVCGKCLHASYDELICHCGHTVIYPPVACGTTINCSYPCARASPSCGHPKTPHNCHEEPLCPPCPYLTEKPCACGKDQHVKNVRCSQERISCGQICGKLLKCGYHTCEKLCHKQGQNECQECTQTCKKPKRICGHACQSTCHAPVKCPENEACQAIVTQSCACGHLSVRTSCGASIGHPTSRDGVVLKCNSECLLRQRNARLADALGIKVLERGLEDWSAELRNFALGNYGFVKTVEGTFKDFFSSTRQTMILPHMPPAKRSFVINLADVYKFGRELIDQEPNRSVQIRRRIDTRIPNPLLSTVVLPQNLKPSLGGLTNLKKSITNGRGWGSGSGVLVPTSNEGRMEGNSGVSVLPKPSDSVTVAEGVGKDVREGGSAGNSGSRREMKGPASMSSGALRIGQVVDGARDGEVDDWDVED